MKPIISRLSLLFSLLIFSATVVWTQTPAANKATATVSGRITLGEQGVPNVEVVLSVNQENRGRPSAEQIAPLTATTNAEGRYQLTGVPAGRYRLAAYAPAYVVAGQMRNAYEAGKTLSVAEGETVENMDFALVRGGVITGRVIDADGKPVIEQRVFLVRVRENDNQPRQRYPGGAGPPAQTDDRGVYRLFGLEAGRYRVATGVSADDVMPMMNVTGGRYPRTFHPDVSVETEAKIIEVEPGSVAEDVDITLGRGTKGFAASGRVIDAETGKPIAGVMIGLSIVKGSGGGPTMGTGATNSRGEFRIEGLTPNSYAAFVFNQPGSDSYSEPAHFEISGGDVTGLEVKTQRGVSISGTAIVEGVRDPRLLAHLPKIRIHAWTANNDRAANLGGNSYTNINPDGSFRITGLRPGKVGLNVSLWEAPKGFALQRIEYQNAPIRELELRAGEHIVGVRVVLAYGQGSIAGRVEIKGGTLPPDVRMGVNAQREGQAPNTPAPPLSAEVDSRGQFLLEGLPPGNYTLMLNGWWSRMNEPLRLPRVEQTVTITGNTRQEAILVVDLTPKEGRQ